MMLDAGFLVDLVRGDPGARAFLEQAERASEPLRVPAPALAKFWEAVHRSRHPPRDLERVREVLLATPGASLRPPDALRAGRILARAADDAVPLDPLDAMTAAVALGEDEALVTRNARDYDGIDGLRVRTY